MNPADTLRSALFALRSALRPPSTGLGFQLSAFQCLSFSLYVLALTPGTSLAAAATSTQSASFAASNAGGLYQGSGNTNLVSTNFFSANLQPFNAALGALQSFTVTWEVSVLLSGFGGPDTGGNASCTLGGSFHIAGSAYSGGGTGNGNGTGPGQFFEVTVPPIINSNTLTVANAGVNYDPAILAAVTGASPFGVAFNSAVPVSYGTVSNFAASVSGTVTLTYTYEPAAAAPTVWGITTDGSGNVIIHGTTTATTVITEKTTDLANGPSGWTAVSTNPVTGGAFGIPIPEGTDPRAFFRVKNQ